MQTVALRVSEEMRVSLGAEVGYSIRFEEVTTPVRIFRELSAWSLSFWNFCFCLFEGKGTFCCLDH